MVSELVEAGADIGLLWINEVIEHVIFRRLTNSMQPAIHCQMEGDTILTHAEAEKLHDDGYIQGFLVMWVVTWNTSDYPRRAAARPHFIGRGTQHVLRAVLLADSLDRVRQQLPHSLTKMDRQPDDDPIIVEVWV